MDPLFHVSPTQEAWITYKTGDLGLPHETQTGGGSFREQRVSVLVKRLSGLKRQCLVMSPPFTTSHKHTPEYSSSCYYKGTTKGTGILPKWNLNSLQPEVLKEDHTT